LNIDDPEGNNLYRQDAVGRVVRGRKENMSKLGVLCAFAVKSFQQLSIR
jgi:hypothetical protein